MEQCSGHHIQEEHARVNGKASTFVSAPLSSDRIVSTTVSGNRPQLLLSAAYDPDSLFSFLPTTRMSHSALPASSCAGAGQHTWDMGCLAVHIRRGVTGRTHG